MTSNAGQPPSTSSSTSPLVFTVGEDVRVIQIPNFDIGEKLRQTSKKEKATFVDSLPSELLSYIFVLGSEAEEDGDGQNDGYEDEEGDEDEDEDEDTPIVRHTFKVLVSHVCRRWRLIVLGTSTLWTHLDFSEGPPFDKSRAWLERSKECPLIIDLDCTVDDNSSYDDSDDQADTSSHDDDLVAPEDRIAMPGGPAPIKAKESSRPRSSRISPADLPVVRDLILPHVSRWRMFELMVDDYQVMHGILSTLASVPEAPQLDGLRLFHYDSGDDYDHFSPPSLKEPFAPFCGRAPSLVQASLWGVHVDWEACVFLQGLEELELAYHAKDVRPPYEIFSRILQRSPDLHILTLCASGPAGNPEDWPTDVIELPSVKHLVLAFVEPSYASALMKRLVFPNLSTLALDFDVGDYSSFLAQLARPSPNERPSLCQNLIDLKIAGMQCSNQSLAAFYAALSNLASLNLNCYHLSREFFDYLYPGFSGAEEVQGCYLPKLQTLTTAGITGGEMRDLLSSRTAVPIKHILMDSEADVDREEEEWLREKVESFDFFEGSDDEDEDDDDEDGLVIDFNDDPAPAEIDEDAQPLPGGFGETPGEWIDDDDNDNDRAPTGIDEEAPRTLAGEAGTPGRWIDDEDAAPPETDEEHVVAGQVGGTPRESIDDDGRIP